MKNWRRMRLEDAADWSGGLTPSMSNQRFWADGAIPWISSKDVRGPVLEGTSRLLARAAVDETPVKLLAAGSVVLVVRSGILRHTLPIAYVPFETTVNQDIKAATPRPGVDGRFLSLSLQAHSSELLRLYRKAGTTVESINFPALLQHEIDVPPLDVQRRVIDLANALDDGIASLDTEAAALRNVYAETIANAVSAHGREPIELGACLSIEGHREKVLPDKQYRMAGVLRSGEGLIDNGPFRGADTTYASLYRLRAGQLIMRKLTAWEGPITVVPDEFDGFVASPEFPTFNFNGDLLDVEFMRHVCRWPGLWQEMKARITGSVQRRMRLTPEQLLAITLHLPSVQEQQEIATWLSSLDQQARAIEAESSELGTVRSSLLRALLSGEVEIPESYDTLFDLKEAA